MDESTIINLWIGAAGGIGGSAGWALLCFFGRSIKICRVRWAFRKSIITESVAGGADYRTGAFKLIIRNRTPWDLIIRSVELSSKADCTQSFPLKFDPLEDISKLHQIKIPPEWGEFWSLTLPERVNPRSGFVKYESEGFFGGIVIRRVKFTDKQMESVRSLQLGALEAQRRLKVAN